ncbi:hypothetical protein B0H34DRAFT_801607 [Crassisporium funariophilum]|nr:hypothetical protein B0H34DRAFT_801607 [Crassisporium funariophilum]
MPKLSEAEEFLTMAERREQRNHNGNNVAALSSKLSPPPPRAHEATPRLLLAHMVHAYHSHNIFASTSGPLTAGTDMVVLSSLITTTSSESASIRDETTRAAGKRLTTLG